MPSVNKPVLDGFNVDGRMVFGVATVANVEIFSAMPKPVRIQVSDFQQLVPPPPRVLEFFVTLEDAKALRDALSMCIASHKPMADT